MQPRPNNSKKVGQLNKQKAVERVVTINAEAYFILV